MSLNVNKKYIAGNSKNTSLKNEILGSNLRKSPKQPQSVTFMLLALYSAQFPKLKKLTPSGTYPVRYVKPVKNVKTTTRMKNNQLVSFFLAPIISISPKTISKVTNPTEIVEENSDNLGKIGAMKLIHVPSNVVSNSVKYCTNL